MQGRFYPTASGCKEKGAPQPTRYVLNEPARLYEPSSKTTTILPAGQTADSFLSMAQHFPNLEPQPSSG